MAGCFIQMPMISQEGLFNLYHRHHGGVLRKSYIRRKDSLWKSHIKREDGLVSQYWRRIDTGLRRNIINHYERSLYKQLGRKVLLCGILLVSSL